METIKQEIQSMYNYLTGNSYDEFELNQMSNRELRGLHSETGKYKYSTRQKSAAKKSTPNVDLNNLF